MTSFIELSWIHYGGTFFPAWKGGGGGGWGGGSLYVEVASWLWDAIIYYMQENNKALFRCHIT